MSNWHDACDLLKSAKSDLPPGWRQRAKPLPPGVKKMSDKDFSVLVGAGNAPWRREFAKDIDKPRFLDSPPEAVAEGKKTNPKGTAAKLKRLSVYKPIPKKVTGAPPETVE